MIENQVPINFYDTDVYAFVAEDTKHVFLPYGETYTLRFIGTDDGTMTYTVDTIDMLSDLPVATKTFENVDLYPGREMLSHIVANTPDVELLLVQNGVVVGDIATDGTTTMRPQTPTPPQTPPAAPPQQPDPTPTPPQGSPLDSSPASLLPVVPREPQPAAAPAGEPTNDAPYYMDYDDEAPTEAPQTVAMPIPAPPQSANRLTFTANHTQYSLNGTVKTSVGAPFIDPAVGRMMIPLRTVAEALGVAAEWDSSAQAAVISLPTGVLTLPVDQQLPDGMGAPLMVNDHLFIPLRFVMYAFDATVAWDGANRAAVITW
ncbi:MAG: copper amine oxidase N-terminal domain-containing protein [Defluviitaleaceae bacterium]|nr:copper amine oxidase N-terminal domain-containing protein [Defluviitaleaceae bacterium]